MAKVLITQYQAEFNPRTNLFVIVVHPAGMAAQRVPIETMDEFNAVLNILSRSNVFLDTMSGDIEIPTRPVGT